MKILTAGLIFLSSAMAARPVDDYVNADNYVTEYDPQELYADPKDEYAVPKEEYNDGYPVDEYNVPQKGDYVDVPKADDYINDPNVDYPVDYVKRDHDEPQIYYFGNTYAPKESEEIIISCGDPIYEDDAEYNPSYVETTPNRDGYVSYHEPKYEEEIPETCSEEETISYVQPTYEDESCKELISYDSKVEPTCEKEIPETCEKSIQKDSCDEPVQQETCEESTQKDSCDEPVQQETCEESKHSIEESCEESKEESSCQEENDYIPPVVGTNVSEEPKISCDSPRNGREGKGWHAGEQYQIADMGQASSASKATPSVFFVLIAAISLF